MSEGDRGQRPQGQPPQAGDATVIRTAAERSAARPVTEGRPGGSNGDRPAPPPEASRAAPAGPPSGQPQQSGTPAWAVPAADRPKTSLRDRLGLAKKDEEPADGAAPTAAAAWQRPGTVGGTATGASRTGSQQPVRPGTSAGSANDTNVLPVVPTSTPSSAGSAPSRPVPAKAAAAQAAVTEAGKPRPGTARRTRKARLRLSRLDPWSVMKTSFLFSIAGGIMLVVAVYVVWTVIGSSGLFDSVNEMIQAVVSTPGDTTPFQIEQYVNTQKVMGVAALLACVDVVIFTAIATLGSFLYNLAATMLGGLEVTLAED
ncbi:hypothetical protein GCM10009841_04040 [Microlunatus panaciterrae]|uniref:DUF3566 domain-containing protein n=1 Tax=Microlunatus panaciterrae TaxID=400768 RepID=A0ABS2RKB1_9ACTN|nr:hypothetical protein [Microlunatus panaciterrae]